MIEEEWLHDWLKDWFASENNDNNICKWVNEECCTVFRRNTDGRYKIVYNGEFSYVSYATQRQAQIKAADWVRAHLVSKRPRSQCDWDLYKMSDDVEEL